MSPESELIGLLPETIEMLEFIRKHRDCETYDETIKFLINFYDETRSEWGLRRFS